LLQILEVLFVLGTLQGDERCPSKRHPSDSFWAWPIPPFGVRCEVLRVLQIDEFVEMMRLRFLGSMETLIFLSDNQQKRIMSEDRFGGAIAEIVVFCIVGNDYLHFVVTVVGANIDTENLLVDKISMQIAFEESNLYSCVQEFLVRPVDLDA
jgi:hypothetical protein